MKKGEIIESNGVSNMNQNQGNERIIPLEEIDKRHTFKDVKLKMVLLAEGERTFVNNDRKEIEYSKINCLQVKGPGAKDKDGNCTIEIPILSAARFLKWREEPEHKKYFNDLKNAELKKNTDVSEDI